MQKESLTALVRQHLDPALTASRGRSAHNVYGGHEHVLRQTLSALQAGTSLDEHENPVKPPFRCCTAAGPSSLARTDGTVRPEISCSFPTPVTVSRPSRTLRCS
jgi:hypothetical protein